MEEINSLEMFQALATLLSTKPASADAVFFHARGFGDDDGLFELAAQLIKDGAARFVAINGFDGEGMGSEKVSLGKDEYLRRLEECGLERSSITLTEPARNTRDENTAFLGLARERGWQSAIIIAQPHQLFRIILGALNEMKRRQMSFILRWAYPSNVDWQKLIRASQGEVRNCRFDDIRAEFERIPRYIAKGDLVTLGELIEYLRKP